MPKPEQEKIIWPWLARVRRACFDNTGLGIGWTDDAKRQFGESRVERASRSPDRSKALAYPVRGAMEDRKLRIPYDPAIRADLRAVIKSTTPSRNIRFYPPNAARTARRPLLGALALALHAGSTPAGRINRRHWSAPRKCSPPMAISR